MRLYIFKYVVIYYEFILKNKQTCFSIYFSCNIYTTTHHVTKALKRQELKLFSHRGWKEVLKQWTVGETGYCCNTFGFSNYNSLNFAARVHKLLHKVTTFVYYKWHQFNPRIQYKNIYKTLWVVVKYMVYLCYNPPQYRGRLYHMLG